MLTVPVTNCRIVVVGLKKTVVWTTVCWQTVLSSSQLRTFYFVVVRNQYRGHCMLGKFQNPADKICIPWSPKWSLKCPPTLRVGNGDGEDGREWTGGGNGRLRRMQTLLPPLSKGQTLLAPAPSSAKWREPSWATCMRKPIRTWKTEEMAVIHWEEKIV